MKTLLPNTTSLLIVIAALVAINSAQAQTSDGPFIYGYGKVFKIETAKLTLDKRQVHKALFDIFTTKPEEGKVDPLLNTIARYLNMHGQTGVPLFNLKSALVLHGGSAHLALNDEDFKTKFGYENPNSKLVSELQKAGVELWVCGQSFSAKGYKETQLDARFSMALSAMTVLVHFNEQGYATIDFN